MIRAISALDSKRGIADEKGIPWKLPADVRHEHGIIKGSPLLMGFNTYLEFDEAPAGNRCFVYTRSDEPLKQGFQPVRDLDAFLRNPPDNLWLFGGAKLFAKTIGYAEELYLTRIDGDFGCTKFFPEFEDNFVLDQKEIPLTENGITFHYEVWKRKA